MNAALLPLADDAVQRLTLDGISWSEYRAIGEILRDRPALRLTFDEGRLEIMTTSPEHEKYKVRLGRLIEILAEEFGTPLEPGGNMTFQREDRGRGLEPDQCYWIANEAQVRNKDTWDPAIDPPPDLAVEIEVSRSAAARLGIYAVLGVPEIWRFDGEHLRVLLLGEDIRYHESATSQAFSDLRVEGMEAFVRLDTKLDYMSMARTFREWVRAKKNVP